MLIEVTRWFQRSSNKLKSERHRPNVNIYEVLTTFFEFFEKQAVVEESSFTDISLKLLLILTHSGTEVVRSYLKISMNILSTIYAIKIFQACENGALVLVVYFLLLYIYF